MAPSPSCHKLRGDVDLRIFQGAGAALLEQEDLNGQLAGFLHSLQLTQPSGKAVLFYSTG